MPFKKIFKPVAKVLDKIIPNEIKPALPYLAAFAPVFGPASVQGFLGSTMGRRALTSGLLNIGAQLSQEGNEGDINLLSAGLGALSGAMTVPGVEGGKAIGVDKFGNEIISRGAPSSAEIFRGGAQKIGEDTLRGKGLEALAKGSEFLAKGADKGLFSKEGLQAATLPAATATGDVMQAQARQLEKQAAIDAALSEAEQLADSGARAAAIRNAMNAYGFFTDEEIEETISAAGYKAGGRVGFRFGGIDKAIEMVEEETVEKGKEGIMTAAGEDPMLVEEYNKYVFDLLEQRPNAKPMSFQDFKRMIKAGMKFGGRVKMEKGGDLKEGIMLVADETGGEPDFGSKEYYEKEVADEIMDLKSMMDEDKMYNLGPWRIGMIEELIVKANNKGVDILELTEVYNDAKNTQANWYGSLDENTQKFWKDTYQEDFDRTTNKGIFPGQFDLGFFEGKKGASERDEKVPAPKEDPFNPMSPPVREAKDGGLMDLGGKEMDLRGGGFVPIGKKERADDVPARLSKNEFVMTADAVRAAGGGSVNKGAKRMYNLMNTLEARA
jgi:uncharacterized short protein YbdD (DUF466 family)